MALAIWFTGVFRTRNVAVEDKVVGIVVLLWAVAWDVAVAGGIALTYFAL